MNDLTTTSPSSLHSDMQSLREREAQWMAVCTGAGEGQPRNVGRSSQTAYDKDAGVARLRKLRDYYRQTHQPREVKAIERAITVLREAA